MLNPHMLWSVVCHWVNRLKVVPEANLGIFLVNFRHVKILEVFNKKKRNFWMQVICVWGFEILHLLLDNY